MVQIPINPFDNDRLKTRKVQAMLNDLGVLPAKHDDRPSFLRSRRSAAVLIDRALDGLAVDPNAQKHCCKSSADFMAAINSKFASAYSFDVGEGPVEPFAYADFQHDTYMMDDSASTFDAFLWSDGDNWNAFDPANYMVAGEGLVANGGAVGPAVTPGLAARLLASGFTARIDWLAVHAVDSLSTIRVVLADEPNFANFWEIDLKHRVTNDSDSFIATANTPFYDMGDIGSGECRIALTWDENGCRRSINGGAVDGVTDTLDLSAVNAVLMSFSYGTWRGIGFYPAQADADLPAISTPA